MSTGNPTSKSPSFGKIMLASGIGTLIVLILIGIFKLCLFLGLIGSISSDKTAEVGNDSFLKIDLTKAVYERTPSELSSLMGENSPVGFSDILRGISAAASDSRIKGLYLYMGSTFPYSWGRCEELRTALSRFSESGKPVYAYADNYTQQGYFVASVADSIFLNPSGIVEFRGIGAEAMFYKEMLDKLAVRMTLVRPKSNSFKSAGETYTMNRLSDANRKQIREYIASIWNYVVDQISETRDIAPEQLNAYADRLECALPQDAVANRLVDRLCFENDILASIESEYSCKKTVEVSDYCKTAAVSKPSASKNKIAVIYAEGDVVTGGGYAPAVYSDNITRALNDAAADASIKAIVLRVNSPGGAVTASEIMTDAVLRARQHKPVIVSMGDVAASAGYEISCNANYIVAEPTTLTGSIGVFAAIPEVGGTLKRYLGITTDTVKTNANSTALSILRPMSPAVLDLMQRNVEDFYTVFVSRVAKGRNLPYEHVDSIARGRVWTGHDALRLGLVDALGGLDDAVSIAADSAGVSDYRVVDYPSHDDLLTELMNRSGKSSGVARSDAPSPLSDLMPHAGDGVWVGGSTMVDILNRICDTKGLQARVEFFLLTE